MGKMLRSDLIRPQQVPDSVIFSVKSLLKLHYKNTRNTGDTVLEKRDQKNNELQKHMDRFNQRSLTWL